MNRNALLLRLSPLAAQFALTLWCSNAQALDNKLSGFGSLVAGRTFGDCVADSAMATKYQAPCTRYIADWGQEGVYTPNWSAAEESRLGVQWTGTFSPQWSATVQAVSRLNEGQRLGLEWAYLTYKVNPTWQLQVGRKRLPLYFFSDFQDIGYAYPTVRPSPDVYGWDIVNYNGVNLDYSADWGEWSARGSVFGGSERSSDNAYSRIIYDDSKDVKWGRIAGISLELSRDWFSTRLSYARSNFQQTDRSSGQVDELFFGRSLGQQYFYGAAFNVDYEDWLVRSEFAASNRKHQGYKAQMYFVTVGHRFGAFTPAVSSSAYIEDSTVGDQYVPVRNHTTSLTLRYELNKSSALKLQIDRARDHGPSPYAGDAHAVAISYDFVF